MPNRLAGETSPYLLQHQDNPVDWYPWGEEALAARPPRAAPTAGLDRLLGLSLVPRDGARVLRGRRDRGADERALRLHQGRPRGAPRRRRDVHGGLPGDDRPGRLAAERVPHPRPGAVLRRHLLPAGAPHGLPSWRTVLEAVAEPGTSKRDEIRQSGAADARRARRQRPDARPEEPITQEILHGGGAGAALEL